MRNAVLRLLSLAIVGLGLGGCSFTSGGANSPTLRSGIYNAGTPATPHYFLSLTVSSGGSIKGSLQFIYEDGQTVVVLPFSGTVQSGVATLKPSTVPQAAGSNIDAFNVPSSISATYTKSDFRLGECSTYLPVPSLADCSFSYSSNGID